MRRGPMPPRDVINEQHVVTYDIETIVADGDEPVDGSFPPWPRHQPVAAAFLTARWTPGGYQFRLATLMCAPGKEAAFYEKVEEQLPVGVTGVGFNSRGFDNRVLAIDAMRHAPGCGFAGLARQTSAGRFHGAHVDLADAFGGMGGARPVALAEICHALDIPTKTSTNGSEVGELWRTGRYRAIREYVREDTLATYLAWLHHIAYVKSDQKFITLPLADLSAWLETEPGLAHLRTFADCRPARVARARAPALRVEAALAEAERRATRDQDEAAFAAGSAASG